MSQSFQQSLIGQSFSSQSMLIATENLGWPCRMARAPVASKIRRWARSSLDAVIPAVEELSAGTGSMRPESSSRLAAVCEM